MRLRVPEVGESLARQVAGAVEALRELDAVQAARRRRDDRLGRGARPPRRRPARRAVGRRPRSAPCSSTARTTSASTSTASPTSSSRRSSAAPERADVEWPGDRVTVDGADRARGDGRRLRPRAARRRARRAGEHRRVVRRGPRRRRPRPTATTSTGRPGRRSCAGRRTSTCSTGRSRCSGTDARRRRPTPRSRAGDDHARRRHRRRRDGDEPDDARRRATTRAIELRFSMTEVLRHKDFADYDDAELAEAHRLMARLRLAGSPRRSLRLRRTPGARRGPTCAAPCGPRCAPRASRSRRHFRDAGHAPPPARAAARRQRLDGALRPGPAALRAGRGRRAPPGRGVRARHPADPDHPRARRRATPTSRSRQAADRVVDWSGGTRLGDGLRRFNDAVGRARAWPAAPSS